MDFMNKKRSTKYDRVMSRLYNRSRSTVESSSNVTRHRTPSSTRVGAKASSSNLSSGVFSELPVVLNDYVPETPVKKSFVVKPRRTIKSLDPAKSPQQVIRPQKPVVQSPCTRSRGSAPSVLYRSANKWSDEHYRECLSNRPHTRVKELKNEIQEYQERDKLLKLRSRLYKSCGVVLDDVGHVAQDKAVQADPPPDTDKESEKLRKERSSGEDAGAPVPDQQMRFERPRYPVDRYLVESSKKVEMVNIIEDDIWNPEPALRPEDEIILRKLHEMLQSTADDLKLLSGELLKYHEPGVQVKTLPTPLDEEFNEKVHIEEVVNAKFHGHRIIDHPQHKPELVINDKPKAKVSLNTAKVTTGVQVDSVLSNIKPFAHKKLEISRTKVIQIEDGNREKPKQNRQNNDEIIDKIAPVNHSEYFYKYEEPIEDIIKKKLDVQKMPSINIRSELTEHKVLQIDILPESKEENQLPTDTNKVAVITVRHENKDDKKPLSSRDPQNQQGPSISKLVYAKARKVSRMSTGDSTSTNNSSEAMMGLHKPVEITLKSATKSSSRIENNKNNKITSKKLSDKQIQSNLDHWKKKLNTVYGQPSTSRKNTSLKTRQQKTSSRKGDIPSKARPNMLNNKMEYIPYSQLTLGGVRVSDIEQEISDLPNKNDLTLSPILDKILSSRENSFHQNSPRKNKEDDDPKIFTTSDENLMQEVIDIERSITKTLSDNLKKVSKPDLKSPNVSVSYNPEDADSYADDFEDERSDGSKNSSNDALSSNESQNSDDGVSKKQAGDIGVLDNDPKNSKLDLHNKTYIKKLNLSFKNKVDVFEFVHSKDTQDSATQSTNSHKISLKETQTSPRNERPNIHPIHNDLWPSMMDPRGEVGQLLKLEKDLIKKLIIDEYGDLLEKNITKPSTSKERELEDEHNVVVFQKNTQTSPAHVKSVMTSPTRTKTRPTSPFTLTVPVDRQTSPMICVTNEEDLKIEIENVEEDLGISINLSSPRFSLRMPQNSREILSNFEDSNHQTPSETEQKQNNETKTFRKFAVSSSSSVDADNSSSEISSLGEINLRLKRRLRKYRVSSVSESSSSSIPSQCSSGLQTTSILPLRSEGEVSLGQIAKKKINKRESDGEISVGQLS